MYTFVVCCINCIYVSAFCTTKFSITTVTRPRHRTEFCVSLVQFTCCHMSILILSRVTSSCFLTFHFKFCIDCLLVLLPPPAWGSGSSTAQRFAETTFCLPVLHTPGSSDCTLFHHPNPTLVCTSPFMSSFFLLY